MQNTKTNTFETKSALDYFRAGLPQLSAQVLRERPAANPISVHGGMPRQHFTAGLFPALHDCIVKVDTGNRLTNSEVHGVAALYLNLNSFNRKLDAQRPWKVFSVKGSPEECSIISENGVGLRYNQGSWNFIHNAGESLSSYCTEDCSSLLSPVAAAVSEALRNRLLSTRKSLLFPTLVGQDSRLKDQADIAFAIHWNSIFSPTSPLGDNFGRKVDSNRYVIIDALHRARSESNAGELLINLLEQMPQLIFAKGWCGGTMLHDSCEYEINPLIDYILEKSSRGITFIKNGSEVTLTLDTILQIQDKDGFTPLHRIAYAGDSKRFDQLILLGANPYSVDRYGYTAKEVLSRFQRGELYST
jgi:hypothetical protein